MKLLRKVKPIEVKRSFVISDFVSHHKYKEKQTSDISQAIYYKRIAHAKRVILELPEHLLDMIINGEWAKRFRAYNKTQWYVGTVRTDEVGVWKKAGELPLAWTRGSLSETADFVARALANKSKQFKGHARTAIPGILKNTLSMIQKEKYLFPVVLPGGTMGRKGLKKMKGDIDDGCMRSIALAISGKKKIKMYIGKKK